MEPLNPCIKCGGTTIRAKALSDERTCAAICDKCGNTVTVTYKEIFANNMGTGQALELAWNRDNPLPQEQDHDR